MHGDAVKFRAFCLVISLLLAVTRLFTWYISQSN